MTTDENGLYYMRARYYNVDIKRFINQDVLTGTLERISSLNRYSYVEGNPVSYLDPFGLEPFDTEILHDIASVLGLIGSAISIFALQIGLVFSLVAGGMEIFASSYDLIQHIKQNNRDAVVEDIGNIVKGILSMVLSGIGYKNAELLNDWKMASEFKGIMGGYETAMEAELATNKGLFDISKWINRLLTTETIGKLVDTYIF